MFFYFNIAKAYMLVILDKELMEAYLMAYAMVLMFVFFILILRLIELISYYSDPNLELHREKDLFDLKFDIIYAILCGLMVNEIVTNAIKYPFVGSKEGVISLGVSHDDHNVCLYIGDDGIGLLNEFDISEAKSLGLQLVHDLLEQLNGDLKIDSMEGTHFRIVFP
ncbi:sensor histidine kinase [Brumimicrobium oceani]|nr:ATP-binding protein [Brumimicrobium oceani]